MPASTLVPLSSINVDAVKTATFGPTTSNVALPGTPASDSIVVLTNLSTMPVLVKLGTGAVTVTISTGSVVMPGQQRVLAINGATNLAGIVQGASTYNSVQYGILVIETGN